MENFQQKENLQPLKQNIVELSCFQKTKLNCYRFINKYKTELIFLMLFGVHIVSTFCYNQYCTISFTNWSNLFMMMTPMCSYLLQIIVFCHNVITQLPFIIGGYIIVKMSSIFSIFSAFDQYKKKPIVEYKI